MAGVAAKATVDHLRAQSQSLRYLQMASGMKFPLSKPNGLKGSPGLRAIGGLESACGEFLRASGRRGANFKPHCAARQRRILFPERRWNQPLREFVPDLCQIVADLAGLGDLERRKNSKLRASTAVGVPIPSLATTYFQRLSEISVPPECLTGVQMESNLGFRSIG